MANIMTYHLVLPHFVHDQIISYWKPAESGFPRCFPQVGRLGNPLYHLLDASDKSRRSFSIISCYVCEDPVKISESATFISNLHALR